MRSKLQAKAANASWPDQVFEKLLPAAGARAVEAAEAHIREGRFQRSLSVLAGVSSALTGVEVAYQHYRAGYGQQIMYTPVALGGAMTIAGVWGAFSRRAARTVLRWTSAITLLDGLIGFYFHLRGIHRKPGGWRLPIVNIVTGPPIFAPVLFGLTGYLGLIASYLRPEEAERLGLRAPKAQVRSLLSRDAATEHPWTIGLREGRFQKHLAAATVVSTFCTGSEALYSHYKNNFRHTAQWSPIIIAPLLIGAAAGAMRSPRVARTWLPLVSAVAIVNGGVGFFYHARAVLRRPGGMKKPFYNLIYGPPVFAPLLFSACGIVGLLASLMRRER